jgi:hypothetical protein
MGVYREHTYRRGMALLAGWGYPEPGDLGPRESPALLGEAAALLARQGVTVEQVATRAGLPTALARTVVEAATEHVPELSVAGAGTPAGG